MIIVQSRTLVAARIPVLPNREQWLCSFDVFFHIFWWIATIDRIIERYKITTHEYMMKENKGKNPIFRRHNMSYPFAKSKRKSWKPTFWHSHRSHPMISFLTKSWVWSILGNPWKMAPVFLLPWNKQRRHRTGGM